MVKGNPPTGKDPDNAPPFRCPHAENSGRRFYAGRGGPLEIESLELEGPRDDEVLVRIIAAGICRTDIDLCDEWNKETKPVVLRHEGAGVVERFGGKVKNVKGGDHVVLSCQPCGRCPPCRIGNPANCRFFYEANFGFKRLDGSNAL